jgi:hypothetical protein
MKTRRWLNRTRFFSIMRIASAGALVILAAAIFSMALTATVSVAANHSNHAPPISGFLEAISDLVNDPSVPGIRPVTRSSCTDGTDLGGGNIRMNCDSINLVHNELTISVDPADSNHIVAGSNGLELFNVGRAVVQRIIAAYYTSTDGGTTWLNGHIEPGGFTFNGDPSVAFNKKLGLVHYGTSALNGGQRAGFTTPAIQVNTSSDGGLTFGRPVVVARGTGVTVDNDKPYITVDNNPTSPHFGRLYVTYTRFLFHQSGNYLESPIYLSFSDDGGEIFSTPQQISGTSTTLCSQPAVPANAGLCNEDQLSIPAVGPGGTLYVAFENQQHAQTSGQFRNQYLVVRSTDGGSTFGDPVSAVFPIYDGVNDYPISVNGRQTLSNSQFRVNSGGNMTVDLTSGPASSSTMLYIAFSDNRNGTAASTNTDIVVVKSTDGGTSWNAPVVLTSANDQFYPWATVGADGNVRVAFSDRSYDPSNIQYGETLASSFDGGTSFSSLRVDTGLSNPNDSRFVTNGGTTNGKATFIGDYNGLDIGSDLVLHPAWTDMRTSAYPNPPPGTGHKTQDAVTASVTD